MEGDDDPEVIVNMRHIVDARVAMTPIEDFCMLPTTMNRDEREDSIRVGAYHLSDDSHASVVAEMHRRERLDHEEILVEMQDMEEGEQIMRNDEDGDEINEE